MGYSRKMRRSIAKGPHKWPDPGKGGDLRSVEQVAKDKGFELERLVVNQASSNKFLGSERERSAINPNGYDPVQRATEIAQSEVLSKLQEVMDRHG